MNQKNNPIEFLQTKKIAIKVVMDCRATLTHEFRTNLGFKRHDINLTKKQSVMTKTLSSFEAENM